MPHRVVDLVLAGLAAYRLTWMILAEEGPADILQHLRDFVYEHYDESHWVYRGIECPYCISFWLVMVFLIAPPFLREWFGVSEVVRRVVDYERSHAK